MPGPDVLLDEQADVVRCRLSHHVRRRQRVCPGGQLVCLFVAIQTNVGGDPLQAQLSAPVRQLCRLLPYAPHQQGVRVSVLKTHQGHSGVAQWAQCSGKGSISSSRSRPSPTPTSSAVAEEEA
ncbi:uncharacterized protein LOC144163213 [Haemaphysalis longicornis]